MDLSWKKWAGVYRKSPLRSTFSPKKREFCPLNVSVQVILFFTCSAKNTVKMPADSLVIVLPFPPRKTPPLFSSGEPSPKPVYYNCVLYAVLLTQVGRKQTPKFIFYVHTCVHLYLQSSKVPPLSLFECSLKVWVVLMLRSDGGSLMKYDLIVSASDAMAMG